MARLSKRRRLPKKGETITPSQNEKGGNVFTKPPLYH